MYLHHEAADVVWSFKTKTYRVDYIAIPEGALDLSWDEDNIIAQAIDDGKLVAFTAELRVTHLPTDTIIGGDFLGECIHESAEDFIKGSMYFRDMVRGAVQAARENAPRYAMTLRAA